MIKQLTMFDAHDSKTVQFETIPSLMKWTGSKRSQAKEIINLFPTEFNCYSEPFVGSGAILFLAAQKHNCLASDIYGPLIEFWQLIKNDVSSVIQYYNNEWNELQDDFPNHFYTVRERFNKHPNGLDLLFLARTCVNGIIRFNKEGKFNNSLHLSRRGMKPQRFENIATQWNKRLKNTNFQNCDYVENLATLKPGDFCYMDPPYLGSSNRYIKNLDFKQLLEQLESLNRKGVYWAMSFDGERAETSYDHEVPKDLYKNKNLLSSGNSAVKKVLDAKNEEVLESLYTNY